MDKRKETLPALARLMQWVDHPAAGVWSIRGLVVACILLFLVDFTYEKYGFFAVETIPGIYGIFGILTLISLVLAARILRHFVQRAEDYYGDKAVDPEEYPEDQLDRSAHDA